MAEDKIIISNAKSSDVDSWMELVDTVGDDFPGLDKADYLKTLKENIKAGTAICAKCGDTVAGALLFSTEKNELSFLAVHPDFRGRRIAGKMMDMMMGNFPKGAEITVTTYREGDEKGAAARRLYEKYGFEEGEVVEEMGYPCQRFIFIK